MSRCNLTALFLSLCVVLASCASRPPAPASQASSGYDLRIDGNEVSLAFRRDLTVPEFLQLAQEVTCARYLYDRAQVANAGPVTLVGQVRCRRNEFPELVGTMLYLRGLRAETRGSGDTQYVEIVPAAKG